MKKGIVLAIKGKKAVVMKNGGEFMEIQAADTWKAGDVVSLPNQPQTARAKLFYAVAACCVFCFLTVFGGMGLYNTEVLLISMDINPSFELSINCFDKVISVTCYNEEATRLIDTESIKGLSYWQAIEDLLQSSSLQPYLEGYEHLDFAVCAKTDDTAAMEYLNTCAQNVRDSYPQMQVNCNKASASVTTVAHSHHMSLGKYLAFLELQEAEPGLEADDYCHYGIGEIRSEIHQRKRNGNGQEQEQEHGREQGQKQGQGQGNSDKGPHNQRGY